MAQAHCEKTILVRARLWNELPDALSAQKKVQFLTMAVARFRVFALRPGCCLFWRE